MILLLRSIMAFNGVFTVTARLRADNVNVSGGNTGADPACHQRAMNRWSIMDGDSQKSQKATYYLPLTTALLGLLSVAAVATGVGGAGTGTGIMAGTEKHPAVNVSLVTDGIQEQQVRFAADQGVADPEALVAAVRHRPMAHLLISVAIEESRGNPVAVGLAGEEGAWQVKASSWGAVPGDIRGQADQAERIIQELLLHAKGNCKKALARYNGGTTPPVSSYRYAERILKRAKHLQIAVNRLPPAVALRAALLGTPDHSPMLSSLLLTRVS